MSTAPLPTPVEWAQDILRRRIPAGAWVVDATAGNGFDTLFLAECVGSAGRVFAFDVQVSAIHATRERLASANMLERCVVNHAGHERMAEVLPAEARGKLAAVMFNLGWLPGHDKTRITRPETTLAAAQSAVDLLAAGGLVTIVVYPNHEGGDDEAEAVAKWVGGLCARSFEVRHLSSHYRQGRSPECWAIRKR